jgi:hypothetical protein
MYKKRELLRCCFIARSARSIVTSCVTKSPIHRYFSVRFWQLSFACQHRYQATDVPPTTGGTPEHRRGAVRAGHIEPETKMNNKLLLPLVTAMTLAAASTSALAGAQASDFRGNAAPAQAVADQVIVITEATRHVNVTGGSTVRFVVGDKSFNWSFQNGSAHVLPFDLQQIAPQGLLTHAVTAYVSDNPLYQNC